MSVYMSELELEPEEIWVDNVYLGYNYGVVVNLEKCDVNSKSVSLNAHIMSVGSGMIPRKVIVIHTME